MRICVVTSLAAAAEPRAPRHASAAKQAFPDAEVLFVDHAPMGHALAPEISNIKELTRITISYPWRGRGLTQLAARKARTAIARASFSSRSVISEAIFAERTIGLTRKLKKLSADIYIAHNIETLLPAYRAAKTAGAQLVFDCMEYYSDMGDGQTIAQKSAVRQLEAAVLPECALVLASSEDLADVLADEYGIRRPLALYNMPCTESQLPKKLGGGLNLYWRNGTIGFGQRGLEDALHALPKLPEDVCLHVQGRITSDFREFLQTLAKELGVAHRLNVLPPYSPSKAVVSAAPYDVGLCLERTGPRNHALTVSNKMFDYHMAGLAVITSDMPSLARVVEHSQGGITFKAGSRDDLVAKVLELHSNPQKLARLSRQARQYALREGNETAEILKLVSALRSLVNLTGRVNA